MSEVENHKPFGIKITLPPENTLHMAHLLGEHWVSYRWFETAKKRDQIFNEMNNHSRYYRDSDVVKTILEKVQA